MAKDPFMIAQRPTVSAGYRIFRWLVRSWLGYGSGKVRALEPESAPEGGPAVLVVGHPGTFHEALTLVAACECQLRCLVERQQVRGSVQRFIAWGLSMCLFETHGENLRRAVETASNSLGRIASRTAG